MSWSQYQQAFARRSFEASQIEISVTPPSARVDSTTRVFPSPIPSASAGQAGGMGVEQRFSFDRYSRSVSLAGDTSGSASSSGTDTDPLESPPADREGDGQSGMGGKDISMRSSVSSQSSTARPQMRHFPSLAALRDHRAAARETAEKYTWKSGGANNGGAQEQERSASDIGTGTGAGAAGPGVKKRFRAGVEHLITAKGRRRSQLLKKLKEGAGARLSRLFSSSDGSDIWTVSKDPSVHHEALEQQGQVESGSGSESDENFARADPNALASSRPTRSRAGRGHARRPSMTIDLSTVSTLQHELQVQATYSERASTPRGYRSRNGYSRFITLPTIIGSPSIPQSPPEQYYTPTAGSPVAPFGFGLGFNQAAEQPQSLMGLFQMPAGPGDGDNAPRRNAMDLDRNANGSGIDPLEQVPASPSAPALSAIEADADVDVDMDLDLFSPSIYRAPNLLPMGHTPPISPLELPSLSSPRVQTHMRSFDMSAAGTGSQSGSGSRSSHGSLRMRIDGPPTTASLASVAQHIAPATADAPAKPKLLPRSSADFSPPTDRSPYAIAPRASLPNVHFAAEAISPPSPRPAFSPTLGLMSPRSPRFNQSGFPPVSTPPSLLANPKSLGDPYPHGLSDSASHNLAGNGCACGCEAHAEPNVKRRSSTKRVTEKKPVTLPQSATVSEVASQSASIQDGASDESHVSEAMATMKVNPYFA